jgi:O-antigen/teichoic acid export membrane protein
VRLAAGEAFADAVLPLRVLIVAAALMPVNGLLGYLMIAMHRERDTLWLNVLALALNIGLNVALIPTYGVAAAAWVATASELVILVSALWLVHHYAGFVPSFRVPSRALAAGAVMAGAMAAVGSSMAPAVVVGFAAYLGTLYLLRVHAALRGTVG